MSSMWAASVSVSGQIPGFYQKRASPRSIMGWGGDSVAMWSVSCGLSLLQCLAMSYSHHVVQGPFCVVVCSPSKKRLFLAVQNSSIGDLVTD